MNYINKLFIHSLSPNPRKKLKIGVGTIVVTFFGEKWKVVLILFSIAPFLQQIY